ncbi:dethiobiotin synthase [Salinimonas chungwhensis]|uniref:dethiobiotin synthase n=1 Tax=Salinimonas chungwhensis TaxID=265425 RepID=UPI00037844E3|nr:dethiobiotin synthase [Salinimonas chungwhensis]
MQSFFITGTDTEVGKTYFTAKLLETQRFAGKRVVGYKPVSAGCDIIDNVPVNEDAQALWQASNVGATLGQVNPVALLPPIAPHIAAAEAGIVLTVQQLIDGYQTLASFNPDLLLMEGAGGWQLPLGNGIWMPDVVKVLELPVIMVVGMRLGCLNHALLTVQAIAQTGLSPHGWVANCLSATPMPYYKDNLNTLKQAIDAPLLAEIPYDDELTTRSRLTNILT